jgi:hypothetical protein
VKGFLQVLGVLGKLLDALRNAGAVIVMLLEQYGAC